MEKLDLKEVYPISQDRNVSSSRRIAREKVLQTIYASNVCETDTEELIEHIFNRVFNFDEYEEVALEKDKLLSQKQIQELEADTQIVWSDEHLTFAKDLLNFALKRRQEVNDYLEKFAIDWHPERVSPIDKYIILIAITEMLDFPEIPPKVSINEALDISKMYSEYKSKTFINGILDSIFKKFKDDGLLNKTGRGLMDTKESEDSEDGEHI